MMKLMQLQDSPTSPEVAKQYETLADLAQTAEHTLYECRTVFPFTLFPNHIKVSPSNVSVIFGNFFFSKSVISILIEDLRTVEVDTNILFATIKFEPVGYERKPIVVSWLFKEPALKMRQIVMGLVTAKREGVQLESINQNMIKHEVEKIGDVGEELTSI
jgi:hypothetical protein